MNYIFELYLNKKHIEKEEWQNFIKVISDYNGIFRRWKIIVTNDKNQLRYFIKTRCSLPATINGLDEFLLKPVNEIEISYYSFIFPRPSFIKNSIIDLINYSEIRNKGELKYLEITFIRLYQEKIRSKIKYYLEKNNSIRKYKVLGSLAENILSVDFESNKRFFYKSSPKYLDIYKILHLLNTDYSNALLSIDTFPYLQGDFYLSQSKFSFNKHSVIMGSSGCGKSKFISMLINNINKNNEFKQQYKVVVIDPHASLEDDVGGIGKVIDFKRDINSVDLFINSNDDIVSSTELLLDLFKSLIADQFNSKLERVLRHSIHILLTDETFNFRNLRKIILDLEYRNELIKKLKYNLPISVIDFFLSDFNDLKTKSYGEAISPIIGFIDEMEMIPVFNEDKNNENLLNTVRDNFLTIFSLDRTKLGDKVTKTISGLIMQQLLTIIQRREINEHIIFIIDEVAVVENPILCRYLSEARKYNLSLILAGQYFNQISEELKSSIFANVVNYFIFRVSKLDAITLVDNFDMKVPLDDTKERKIKILTELNNRECIVRVDSNGILLPAFKSRTLDYTSIPRIKSEIIDESGTNTNKKQDKKSNFKLDSNVNLKDILITTSTKRGEIK